jgi:hypothetical protein
VPSNLFYVFRTSVQSIGIGLFNYIKYKNMTTNTKLINFTKKSFGKLKFLDASPARTGRTGYNRGTVCPQLRITMVLSS